MNDAAPGTENFKDPTDLQLYALAAGICLIGYATARLVTRTLIEFASGFVVGFEERVRNIRN